YMFPLSFIQVTNYEPSMSFGYVPDTELLQFASKATNGAFLFTSDCVSLPAPSPDSYPAQRVWAVEDGVWDQYDSLTKNIYHAAFTASTFSSSPGMWRVVVGGGWGGLGSSGTCLTRCGRGCGSMRGAAQECAESPRNAESHSGMYWASQVSAWSDVAPCSLSHEQCCLQLIPS
ncbi:hypothetical protein SARC_14131, partial [Sphaeroforma arctica JP610]